MRQIYKHIPNTLSSLRILAFPVALWLILSNRPDTWFVLTVVALCTDALDGFLARRLNVTSNLGAHLDSIGDFAMYISVIWAVFTWKWTLLQETPALLAVYLVSLGLTYLIALLKFRKVAALHLYSTKVSGVVLTAFVLFLFLKGFSLPFYVAAMGVGILASLEEVLVLFVLDHPKRDIKSLFYMTVE